MAEEKKNLSRQEMRESFVQLMNNGEYATAVRNSKATVFTDVFDDPEYGLELFRVLHPEETDIGIDDIDIVTLKNIMFNTPYNDLGILAGDKFVILVEAQSTWSVNILVRILIYLAYTYKNFITAHRLDMYAGKKLDLPKPEFFVIYTGEGKKPDEIRFSDEFFAGEQIDVEITAKVICDSTEGDVIDQYIDFTHVRDGFVKEYGPGAEAARKTVEYCINHGILDRYFRKKGLEEAISLMMVLFDDATVMRNHDATLVRETERRTFVETYKSLNQTIAETVKAFMAKFHVSQDLAERDVKEYWKES